MAIIILILSWAIIAYTTKYRSVDRSRFLLVILSTLFSAWKINSLGTESMYELLITILIGCIAVNDILYHECEYEFSFGFVAIALHSALYTYTPWTGRTIKLATIVTLILVVTRFLKLHKIGDADIVVFFGMMIWYQYDIVLILCIMVMLTFSVAIIDRYLLKGSIMCGSDNVIPLLAFFAIIDTLYYQIIVYYI